MSAARFLLVVLVTVSRRAAGMVSAEAGDQIDLDLWHEELIDALGEGPEDDDLSAVRSRDLSDPRRLHRASKLGFRPGPRLPFVHRRQEFLDLCRLRGGVGTKRRRQHHHGRVGRGPGHPGGLEADRVSRQVPALPALGRRGPRNPPRPLLRHREWSRLRSPRASSSAPPGPSATTG